MAMEGLLSFALALAASAPAAPPAAAPQSAQADSAITVTLTVQNAMQQARDQLLHDSPRDAVRTLEEQLARINGNPVYLALLRDAYRAFIKQLRLHNHSGEAAVYQQRLQILDTPTADIASIAGSPPPNPAQPAPRIAGSLNEPIFRANHDEDDDPFKPVRQPASRQAAHDLVVRADEKFQTNHYLEAEKLYEQAHQADAHATDKANERWAYCKLNNVVERLNQHSAAYPEMTAAVQAAIDLGPSQAEKDYSQKLLAEIERRRQLASADPEPFDVHSISIRDVGRTPEGWSVAETMNFRIYHNLSPEWVERTAQVAERTRATMQRKWLGQTLPPWSPKCEIFLHANAQDYSRATGVPPSSPGHSSFQLDAGRVLSRRIDLHCDDNNIFMAVLPHEATHVVLAGNFGDKPVPRWADEGIAVLTEPRDKIERHLRTLPDHRQAHQLFPVKQLVNMSDYPDPHYVAAFYAESVSLVEFLSKERGPEVFTQFVRDGLRENFDAALARHYGFVDFADLEARWQTYAFGGQALSANQTANSR
jgi:hypothetical protein